MKDPSRDNTERQTPDAEDRQGKGERSLGRLFLGWMLFPLSLFPFVALMTYDWRTVETLKVPAEPSYNWIGATGDFFAYYGYSLFGLAIWSVPVICAIWGVRLIGGGRLRPKKRVAWLVVFLFSASCLVQLAQPHAAGIDAFVERLNLSNAGGAIGYLAATKFASPLLSDFGSTVVFSIMLSLALVAAVGVRNFFGFFKSLGKWAIHSGRDTAKREDNASPDVDGIAIPRGYHQAEMDLGADGEEIDETTAALRAREEDRDRARAEKEAARVEREAARAEREAAREAIRAEKEAEKAERERAKAAQLEAIAAARKAALAAREEERGRSAAAAQQEVTPSETQETSIVAPISVKPVSTERPIAAADVNAATQDGAEAEKPVDKGPYILPSVDLLKPLVKSTAEHGDIEEISYKLINTLKLFGVDAQLADAVQGPVVTKYELELAPGTR